MAVAASQQTDMTAAEALFAADLSEIRRLADIIPGAKPSAMNGVRVAASIRPEKFVFAGGTDAPVTMPRTAFQLVYPDGTIMIDATLDQITHDSFSTPDKREPFFADEFAKLTRALDAARLIVFTHFHADHTAGVLTAANADALIAKTIASKETIAHIREKPHRPHLAITADQAARFVSVDYERYYPVAPGLVLIKAPGHSADHQMVFVKLADGREVLHSVDVGWVMENIRRVAPKAAPWIHEDIPAVTGQLRWLNRITTQEKNVTVLVTHDDDLFATAKTSGLIGDLTI